LASDTAAGDIDRSRLAAVHARENATFVSRTPVSAALLRRARTHLPNGVPMAWMAGLYRTPAIYVDRGQGALFWDVDGNSYVDFNLCDLSMTMGYAPDPVVASVSRAVGRGAHFLLPTEDSVWVAEELARRTGIPYWQFTLSATSANTEVIRVARTVTGRRVIVVFGGHYHGHLDETLVTQDARGQPVPALLGIPPEAVARTVVLPFNDLEALDRRLSQGDVALVLTEPALTNCTLVKPEPGYLEGLRELTARHGVLLCYDEAHTFQFAYGGLTAAWRLASDFIVLGKGLGSGISFGLYGMSNSIAAQFEELVDTDLGPTGIATGGTTYGSAVAVAAARAALAEVLTETRYAEISELGEHLANGLDATFRRHCLAWRALRLGPRSGYCLMPRWPINGAEAARSLDLEFIDTRRIFMANRGLWDAVVTAGPQVSFAHCVSDVDRYVATADAFLSEICR